MFAWVSRNVVFVEASTESFFKNSLVKEKHKINWRRVDDNIYNRFQLLTAEFSCQLIRVVAVDMRGYGDSEKPLKANQYHLHIIVEDIRQLISKLGTFLKFIRHYISLPIEINRLCYTGKESCVLVGHDWGAAIGWLIASIHPNLLNHYVALSFPHPSVFRYYLTTWKQCFSSRYYI